MEQESAKNMKESMTMMSTMTWAILTPMPDWPVQFLEDPRCLILAGEEPEENQLRKVRLCSKIQYSFSAIFFSNSWYAVLAKLIKQHLMLCFTSMEEVLRFSGLVFQIINIIG